MARRKTTGPTDRESWNPLEPRAEHSSRGPQGDERSVRHRLHDDTQTNADND